MDDKTMADQVAVISGGASGIGKAIAMSFAEAGAAVVLVDVDPCATEVAEEIAEMCGVRTAAIVADVADAEAMRGAAETTIGSFGRTDHLVCAAGSGSGKFGFPFWSLDPADWQSVLQVNLMGVVNMTHAWVPSMVAARRGTILMLSSVAGQIGSQTDPPYSAAKAAVINFAQCAAKDLASYDIRVNTICPGMIKTPLNRSVWRCWNDRQCEAERKTYEEWAEEKIGQVTPLGRWQDPDDIGEMAVFLASSRARNVTGQTINVDGGQVMHS